MRFRTQDELAPCLDDVRRSPKGVGTVELLVRRIAEGEREVLDSAELTVEAGLVGDAWTHRPARGMPAGVPNPLKQVTVMNARMVTALGDTPQEWAGAGDQVYVDLDLSVANLPVGSLLELGTAVLELTEPPHRGCPKFVKAFGKEAMLFVNSPVGRELRLRGVNTRVVRSGTVRVGDKVVRRDVTLL